MTKPYPSVTPQRAEMLRQQGAAIAAARLKAGLTQLQAAEELGVSRAAVCAWEQGRRGCSPENRRTIIKKWKGDPKVLGPEMDCCPSCGRPWAW